MEDDAVYFVYTQTGTTEHNTLIFGLERHALSWASGLSELCGSGDLLWISNSLSKTISKIQKKPKPKPHVPKTKLLNIEFQPQNSKWSCRQRYALQISPLNYPQIVTFFFVTHRFLWNLFKNCSCCVPFRFISWPSTWPVPIFISFRAIWPLTYLRYLLMIVVPETLKGKLHRRQCRIIKDLILICIIQQLHILNRVPHNLGPVLWKLKLEYAVQHIVGPRRRWGRHV